MATTKTLLSPALFRRNAHRQVGISISSLTGIHYACFDNETRNIRASSTSATANNSSVEDPITVRLVSINDVYDLTKLPRLATFIRSLGIKEATENAYPTNRNFDDTIQPSAITLNGDFLSPSSLSSVDNGRGHVAAIRAAGITHVCLGNHEANLPLGVLKDRLNELGRRRKTVVLNSNVSGLGRHTRELDIVRSTCGRIRVGLMGLLSDESDMFRNGTFRGLEIGDVKKKYETMMEKVDMMGNKVDYLVPLTHQSLNADIDLAKWMLKVQSRVKQRQLDGGTILGGHEHTKILSQVSSDEDLGGGGSRVQIVKSGQNSDRAAIVDLQFNASTHTLENTSVHFEELDDRYKECTVAQSIVEKHLSILDQLQDFIVFDKHTMLSEYFVDPYTGEDIPLSSEHTRHEQTTVGAFFCTAIKSELDVDVCIINGAPIKASKVYAEGTMSYDEMRKELPFPLKMVVIEMTRKQLRESIAYSRTNVEKGKPATLMADGKVERRGFLQVDFDYLRRQATDGADINDDQILTVALPRNLLKGFCKIQPLMDLNNELEARNDLPNEDNYIKAIDLIVRYCFKDRWIAIAQKFSFNDLDLNKDGSLSREELRTAMIAATGEDPSAVLVDGMMDSIDDDSNGLIDEDEFNRMLDRVKSQS